MKELLKNHEMEIISNNGFNRHLKFEKQNSRTHWFEIITWIDGLTIHGDFGSYTFYREHTGDMLSFFRGKNLNFDYWAEKLVAIDSNEPLRVFSEEKAKEYLIDQFSDWVDNRYNTSAEVDLCKQTKSWFIEHLGKFELQSNDSVVENFHEFSVCGDNEIFCFDEFDAHDFCKRFKMCCEAIRFADSEFQQLSN